MRIFLWLTIAVFISTLFWPQLLNDTSIVYCLVIGFILLTLASLRILAVIPIAAVYFTFYANLTLTGSLPISAPNFSLPFANSTSLQALVDGQDHNIIVQVNSLISYKNNGYFINPLPISKNQPLKMLFFGDLMLNRHVGEKINTFGFNHLFNKLASTTQDNFFSDYIPWYSSFGHGK